MAKKKKKESDSPIDSLHGDKTRAGQLLSSYLRKVAQEQSEFVNDPDQGDRMATKAEALARLMWKMALGYKEYDPKKDKEVDVRPDRGMIGLIYDRMEGRAPMSGEGDAKRRTIADKVSEQGRNRLNRLANGADSNG